MSASVESFLCPRLPPELHWSTTCPRDRIARSRQHLKKKRNRIGLSKRLPSREIHSHQRQASQNLFIIPFSFGNVNACCQSAIVFLNHPQQWSRKYSSLRWGKVTCFIHTPLNFKRMLSRLAWPSGIKAYTLIFCMSDKDPSTGKFGFLLLRLLLKERRKHKDTS